MNITNYNDEYETCERTFAELRIFCERLSVEQISNLLSLDPTSSTTKGHVITSKTTGLERIHKLTTWCLSSEGSIDSKDLRRHLDWLLNLLRGKRAVLDAINDVDSTDISVYCIWWSAAGDGGPTLSPNQLVELADLNIECRFELAFFGVDN